MSQGGGRASDAATARLVTAAARWLPDAEVTPTQALVGLRDVRLALRPRGSEDPAERLAATAEWHRVGPAMGLLVQHWVAAAPHDAMQAGARDGETAAMAGLGSRLADQRRAAIGAHLRSMSTAGQIARSLDGLPWVLVKGPVLSHVAYPRPDLRWYGDIDVVVGPEAFPAAVTRLETAGFELLDRDFDLARRLGLGQLHLRAPSGTTVDLHHDLTHRMARRLRTSLTVEAVLQGRLPIAGMPGAWRPGPAAAVVHLCAHTAASGADRLGWFADVHHTIGSEDMDWRAFVDLAWRARSAPACLLVLATCRRLLGTDVPLSVDEALQGGPLGRATSLAGALADTVDPPARRRSSGVSVGRALAKSATGSHRATWGGTGSSRGWCAAPPRPCDRRRTRVGTDRPAGRSRGPQRLPQRCGDRAVQGRRGATVKDRLKARICNRYHRRRPLRPRRDSREPQGPHRARGDRGRQRRDRPARIHQYRWDGRPDPGDGSPT